jgi:hypothetical protein
MGFLYDVIVIAQKYWYYALIIAVVGRLVRNKYKPGLHDIPGPFLASISDIWLLIHCLRGKSQKDYLLHRKYNSPLLRLSPNVISVADSDAVRIIYGWKPVFKKVRFIPPHDLRSILTNNSNRAASTFLNIRRAQVARWSTISRLLWMRKIMLTFDVQWPTPMQ